MMSRAIDTTLRVLAGLFAPGGSDGRLATILYHRVLPDADSLNDWDVTADQFDKQLAALGQSFCPLPLAEAVERLATRSLPPRAVCITFDDGYSDNAEVALPLLRRHGIPATFFVATGFLNGGRMWNDSVVESIDRWRDETLDAGWGPIPIATRTQKRMAIAQVLQRWKYLPPDEREARVLSLAQSAQVPERSATMMTDTQVLALRTAGMDIGAHTISHPILAHLDDRRAMGEIVESRRYLSELLREPVALFAYPNGKPGTDYGPRDVASVRAAGFRAAVSTAPGVAVHGTDAYQLPRFTPWDRSPRRYALRLIANYRNASPTLVHEPTAAPPAEPASS